MAKLLSVLSKALWVLLALFVGVYVLNAVTVGEAIVTWDVYTLIAHAIVISVWGLLSYGLGFASKKLRGRAAQA